MNTLVTHSLYVKLSKKIVRIMENPTLPTNWLAPLSNANHDGTTQQIDDAVGGSDMTPVLP